MDSFRYDLMRLFRLKEFPNKTKTSIEELFGDMEIICYGAGAGFQTFISYVSKRHNLEIAAVIDKKFSSVTSVDGIPAFAPEKFKLKKKVKKKAVAVVTVTKPEFEAEIIHYLKCTGFENIVLAKKLYEFNLPCPPPDLEAKGFNYYLEHKQDALKCLELFSDEVSKQVYISFLKTHMAREPVPFPSRPSNEQYFPRDIKLRKGYSRFIHCGAYTGDTVKELQKTVGKIDTLICFEPDPVNYNLLTQYLSKESTKIATNIVSLPCGVYSRECQFRFRSAGPESSISERGNVYAQCVALDSVLPSFKPTFISMDVEGAELEALKGAQNLIKRERPDLAICVYHMPAHIWEIPLYLHKLNLGYKFYLRNYRGFAIETILYATT